MKKAFKLNFSSGETIEIHMTNSDCELSIDNVPTFSLSTNGKDLKISKISDSNHDISSTEEIEFQNPAKNVKPLRKCIDCQGKTYCITNGCANTPCGWICD